MKYLVEITRRAERDLADLYTQVNAQHSSGALEWYQGLKTLILSLESHPARGTLFRKRGNLRQLFYGHAPHIYRVIYRLVRKQGRIEVLHIRHGARKRPKPRDLT